MRFVKTKGYLEADTTHEERARFGTMLESRFKDIDGQTARKRITTMPHITPIPAGDETLHAISLTNESDSKNAVFGLHGEQVVLLGVIQSKGTQRKTLINDNADALREMAAAFKQHKKAHPIQVQEQGLASVSTGTSEGQSLAAKFAQRGDPNRYR